MKYLYFLLAIICLFEFSVSWGCIKKPRCKKRKKLHRYHPKKHRCIRHRGYGGHGKKKRKRKKAKKRRRKYNKRRRRRRKRRRCKRRKRRGRGKGRGHRRGRGHGRGRDHGRGRGHGRRKHHPHHPHEPVIFPYAGNSKTHVQDNQNFVSGYFKESQINASNGGCNNIQSNNNEVVIGSSHY